MATTRALTQSLHPCMRHPVASPGFLRPPLAWVQGWRLCLAAVPSPPGLLPALQALTTQPCLLRAPSVSESVLPVPTLHASTR